MAKYNGIHHDKEINALSVSSDGKRLVSAGSDGNFCFYLIPAFLEADKDNKKDGKEIVVEKKVENYN